MSAELLETIKQQIALLTPQEQDELKLYLEEQSRKNVQSSSASSCADSEETKRRQHMEWLKAHREEYAGMYVALDGDRLVGQGKTLSEAHKQARLNGVGDPFLVRVTSESEVLFGGW